MTAKDNAAEVQDMKAMIDAALKCDGARAALSASAASAKDAVPPEFIVKARASFISFEFQISGDRAPHIAMRMREVPPNAEAAPSMACKALDRDIRPEIRHVKQAACHGHGAQGQGGLRKPSGHAPHRAGRGLCEAGP